MRKKQNFRIIKASGHSEPFSGQKLKRSLERCGLRPDVSRKITDKVSREIYEGSKSRDIYRSALKLVGQTSPIATVHYSLKKSLFDLGPEGHHFETYASKYFEAIGYQTETCRVIQGKFVTHEVDVIARKNKSKIFAECKFHNHSGVKNDIKIALYVKARWDDLKDGPEGHDLSSFFLVSNTAFTKDALLYANGSGLKLLGVNAPAENSFLDEIKRLKLYPVTSLRSLNKTMKKMFLNKGIVLARDVLNHKAILLRCDVTENQVKAIFDEVKMLIGDQ